MPSARVLLILAPVLLLACGASPSGQSTAPPASTSPAAAAAGSSTPAACTLLTKDQVSAALGEAAGDGVQKQVFDASECEWTPASGHNGTVTLDVGPWNGDPGVAPLKAGTPVSGVGDEASADNTGLYVRKGTRGFRIWVFNVSSQSTRLDLEQSLATVLLKEI